MPNSQVGQRLTEDEISLYDRQIRLWGMAAQARMRSAKVLLIGLGSLGTEICKNVVLSGLGFLTILDDSIVTEQDLSSQFFISAKDIGSQRLQSAKARVQELNPRVELTFDTQNFDQKTGDFFGNFDLVIGTELTTAQIIKLNTFTRQYSIPLYLAGSNGLFAYIFIDLVQFEADEEKLKGNQATQLGKISQNAEIIDIKQRIDDEDANKIYEIIRTRHYYKTFQDMLKTATLEGRLNRRQIRRLSSALPLTFALLRMKHVRSQSPSALKQEALAVCRQLHVPDTVLNDEYVEQFARQQGVEFAPVAAVIGGALAQDVINILGKKQPPLNNFIVFDGISLDMPIFEF
ncbi:AOS1 (YPR180W) [Zygosaccharomyces parabailii]|nr:AOS1 (YPR180W) [Zygosaccharomyces parabailii]CDH10546.1 probable DNA damage tolerance protein RHC31 [Zygosaccharomyces bailii ISA1307]